jgi:hypothetical protein
LRFWVGFGTRVDLVFVAVAVAVDRLDRVLPVGAEVAAFFFGFGFVTALGFGLMISTGSLGFESAKRNV